MGDKSEIKCLQRAIFIYGAPASGKSTLGKALAERLGVGFVDLDERIVAEAGVSIPEIFKTRGEAQAALARIKKIYPNFAREMVIVRDRINIWSND